MAKLTNSELYNQRPKVSPSDTQENTFRARIISQLPHQQTDKFMTWTWAAVSFRSIIYDHTQLNHKQPGDKNELWRFSHFIAFLVLFPLLSFKVTWKQKGKLLFEFFVVYLFWLIHFSYLKFLFNVLLPQ